MKLCKNWRADNVEDNENTKEHVRMLRHLSRQLDCLINKAVSIGLKDANIENELRELNEVLILFNKTVEYDWNGKTGNEDEG